MSSNKQDDFAHAISSNGAWSSYKAHQNASFFPSLARGQSPAILWIGCSDSRVPETTILGLSPGDVFVHRNIANIVSATDINTAAVIEYAVVHLKVKHIVLCGHTCCGGAGAALSDNRIGGVLDTWLSPLKAVRRVHEEELMAIKDEAKRAIRLAELNVETGVEHLLASFNVAEAVESRGLQVHGVVYDIASGKIYDLNVGTEVGSKGKSSAGAAPGEHVEGKVVRGNHGMLVFGQGDGAAMAIR